MSGTKVILSQDVYNLGEEGDICEVARGYARNFLIPKALAVPYNRENIAVFESRREAIAKRKEEKRKHALGLKEQLEGAEIVIKMTAGDSGKLFGSVTNTMVVEELKKMGIQVEKKKVDVPSSAIKMVGEYTVKVKLYESELADVKLIVLDEKAEARKEQEAEMQKAVEEVKAESKVEEETEEETEEEIEEEIEEEEERVEEPEEAVSGEVEESKE
jgi:large subunit ribosomal protein L9